MSSDMASSIENFVCEMHVQACQHRRECHPDAERYFDGRVEAIEIILKQIHMMREERRDER